MPRTEVIILASLLCLQGFSTVLAYNCNVGPDFRVGTCSTGFTARLVPPAPVERVMPTIYLNNSKILDITEDAFDTVPELQKLYLNDNFIVDVKPRWFQKLVNLAVLDLSRNQITSYLPGMFQNTRYLQKLYLKNNVITLFDGTFDNFARTTIDLSNNPLRTVIIDRIHTLHINNTNVTDLHIWQATNIYAEYAKIERFSAIEGVTDTMILRGNHLRDLSNFTQSFSQLQHLDVSQNIISILPADTFQHLAGLRSLNLSKIDVYGLYYGTFSNQRSLEVLDLSYNFIWHLNLNKFYPARLRELYVLGNAIWKVTDSRRAMRSLEKVGIAGNELSCERLFKMYYKGMDRGVVFYTPPYMTNYTSDNVAGMPCRNVI